MYGILLDEAAKGSTWLLDTSDYEALPPVDAISLLTQRIIDDYLARPAISRMALDEAMHHGQHIRPRSEMAPILRKVIDQTLAPILHRGAEQGVFRQEVDPALFFWMLFSITTSWFGHHTLMSLVSGPRFEGEAGLALWRKSSIEYLLALLRPADGNAASGRA